MIAPKDFCSAGFGDSVALDTLQHNAHQHNNKSKLKEANSQDTLAPMSSLPSVPDGASNMHPKTISTAIKSRGL
jgi:hypothetical protein